MRQPPCAILTATVLALALAGCSTGVRPDAEVMRAVEREDRRLEEAERRESAARAATTLASAGQALAELASVDVAAGGLLWGPLYMPHGEPDGAAAAPEARVLPPDAPANWPHLEGFYAAWTLEEAQAGEAFADDDESSPSDENPGVRHKRKGGNKKPKLRVDLLRLRLNNNPVSFSGSLKGFKGFQVKATIKM